MSYTVKPQYNKPIFALVIGTLIKDTFCLVKINATVQTYSRPTVPIY
jgi:hypothetical protein